MEGEQNNISMYGVHTEQIQHRREGQHFPIATTLA